MGHSLFYVVNGTQIPRQRYTQTHTKTLKHMQEHVARGKAIQRLAKGQGISAAGLNLSDNSNGTEV